MGMFPDELGSRLSIDRPKLAGARGIREAKPGVNRFSTTTLQALRKQKKLKAGTTQRMKLWALRVEVRHRTVSQSGANYVRILVRHGLNVRIWIYEEHTSREKSG